jgi:hypothetical protein
MYCRIRNRECPSAGEITQNHDELGEKEEESKYTICYREGGRLNCFL